MALSARLRSSRIDPVGPVLALAALGVFLLHGYDAPLRRDLALYAYSGQRVADGVAPYVGVLNRTGPLGHLVNGGGALLARVLHTDSVLTMRAVMTALSVLTVWVLYLVGRDLFGSRLAGAMSATTLLLFHEIFEFATSGPREKTTMLLLVVVALWAVVRRRWVFAGVAVALGTLTWQPSFFLTAPAAAGALLVLPWRQLGRGLVRFAAGGIATTAVFVVVFWLWGALDDFAQCFLLINMRYTQQSSGLDLLRLDPGKLYVGYEPDLVLLLVGLATMVVLAVVRLWRLDRDDPTHGAEVGFGLAAVASVVWGLLFALQSWADVMVMTPLAALGVAAVVHHLLGAVVPRRAAPPRPAAVSVVTALAVVAVAVAGWTSYTTRNDELVLQRRQVAEVLAAAPPGTTVASVGAPQVLVLGHRVNPNPYQMFTGGFARYLQDTYPGGLRGIAALIASEHPGLLTFDSPRRYPFLQPLVTQDYTRVGRGVHFSWYASDALGHGTIQRLRAVVHATS